MPVHDSVRKLKGESPVEFARFFSLRSFANCLALSNYKIPMIKAAITANKFHQHSPAARLLSALVKTWLNTLPDKTTIFIPIPLSKNRQQERGFNQVTKILKSLKPSEHILIKELLVRTRDTPPQTKLARQERLKNLTDAFSFQENIIDFATLPADCRFVLIDDVVTTGTTLRSAYLALRPHLPKNFELTCLAVAH